MPCQGYRFCTVCSADPHSHILNIERKYPKKISDVGMEDPIRSLNDNGSPVGSGRRSVVSRTEGR
jgi:hypothetical protein